LGVLLLTGFFLSLLRPSLQTIALGLVLPLSVIDRTLGDLGLPIWYLATFRETTF
jgi:hypothetical protein